MTNKIITLVRGDDSNFLNQVLLVVHFKTNLNLDGYKARFTVENPTNFIKNFEVLNNAVEVNLDKIFSSTLEVGRHRCNIKLIDTLNRVKTVKNFEINITNEFDSTYIYPNEYELEVVLDDGINKYKNYNELSNKPSINNVILEGNKTFDEIGATRHMIDISNTGIERHNIDNEAHKDIRDQIFNKQDRLIAGANITIIDGIISSRGAQGGVTTDYKDLGNKPKIQGHVLDGDLTLEELGIQELGDYVTEEILTQKGFLTSVPSGYVTEEYLQDEGFLKEIPPEYYTDIQNQEIYATIEQNNLKQDKLTAGDNIEILEDGIKNETIISATIPEEYITEEKLLEYKYTTNETLTNLLDRKQNIILAGDNIRMYKNIDGTYTISALSPKDQAVISSYNSLTNLPQINNVTLIGNKSLKDLGIQPKGEYQNKLTAGDNINIIIDENNDTIISATMPDDMCTDYELQAGLVTKADKAETLSGYGIIDAYTKEEVDNIIYNNINDKITDCIIDAPNGVATYTEDSITIKEGLSILFSDGLTAENLYKNIQQTYDKDTELNLVAVNYDDLLKEFYLVAIYDDMLGISIISKTLYKTLVSEKIKNTETGYVKNINENKIYEMVYQDHGIYEPVQVYIKILGEGTAIASENNSIKITSFTPYSVYRIVNQDELLAEIDKLQPKLNFGDNFVFNSDKLEYKIPYNYITREYLIENNYATQTNVNDAIDVHNLSILSHEDIRKDITNKQNKIYTSNPLKLNNNNLSLNIDNQTIQVNSDGELVANMDELGNEVNSISSRLLTVENYLKTFDLNTLTYDSLKTSSKTIIGAINELYDMIKEK